VKFEQELQAAAEIEASGLGPDDLSTERLAARWRMREPKLTRAEHNRYMHLAYLRLHEPPAESVTRTMTTPDGRVLPYESTVVDTASARRFEAGRVRGNIGYASWLVRQARQGLRCATPNGRARAAHSGQAGHRRRSSASRSSAASGDSGDDGPADEPPLGRRHHDSRAAQAVAR
jgi:hypothetical protein